MEYERIEAMAISDKQPDWQYEEMVAALDEDPDVVATGFLDGRVLVAADRTAQLEAVKDVVRAASNSRQLDPDLAAVTVACISRADVESVQASLSNIKLEDGEYVSAGYSIYSDRIVVSTNISEDRVVKAIDLPRNLLIVEVVEGASKGRLSRTSDASPHYGGAYITSGGVGCSSGFSLIGTRSMTAGHCIWSTSADWFSGSNTFATSATVPNFPKYDLARLQGGGSYDDRIFNENDNTSSADVAYAGNPANGYTYCNYGAVTKRNCFTQTHSNQTFCDALGCTVELSMSNTLGSEGQHGDSGGPIGRSDEPIRARGSVVAETGPVGDYYKFYYHKTSTIQSVLDYILTS
jgi:hypothetical protein